MRIALIFLVLFVAISGTYLTNKISDFSKALKTAPEQVQNLEIKEKELTQDLSVPEIKDFKPIESRLEKDTQIQEAIVEKKITTPGPITTEKEIPATFLTGAGIILETNKQRLENNLLPLVQNSTLDQMAFVKAQDMFQEGYFAHVSPTGVDVAELASQIGYDYLLVGENLALGNFGGDLDVVEAWMGSPGHRENILKPNYTEIGVASIQGIYDGKTTWIAVQEFGLSRSVCSAPNPKLKSQVDELNYELNQLLLLIEEKEAEIQNTNRFNPGQYNRKVNEYNALIEEYNNLLEDLKSLVAEYNEKVKNYNSCVEQKISFREVLFVLRC